MDTERFHIGDILSVTTGVLVSLDHAGGLYNILGYMTGESLMTHQLIRASDECEGSLKAQHPDLADIKVPEIRSEAEMLTFLVSLYPTLGEYREVRPLDAEDHTKIDPIAELSMMRPDAEVITVNVSGSHEA